MNYKNVRAALFLERGGSEQDHKEKKVGFIVLKSEFQEREDEQIRRTSLREQENSMIRLVAAKFF